MTTVRDIMREDVITVHPSASIREVAQTLMTNAIGGVPVVDDDGNVVGVVSATDIVRAAARDPEIELSFELSKGEGPDEDELDETSDFYAPEPMPSWVQPVLLGDQLDEMDAATIMTPATFFVRPDLGLEAFADFLVRGRIHRALVLENGQLVGIATSFDALRALSEQQAASAAS